LILGAHNSPHLPLPPLQLSPPFQVPSLHINPAKFLALLNLDIFHQLSLFLHPEPKSYQQDPENGLDGWLATLSSPSRLLTWHFQRYFWLPLYPVHLLGHQGGIYQLVDR